MDDANTAGLNRALADLRHIIGFDSAQLLRFGSEGAVREVFRYGYERRSAWALANLFPLTYRAGFTDWASSDAPLPPSISECTEVFHEEFVNTTIYRDHLLREGYLDGMSVELSVGDRSIGLAHFSSRRRDAFAGDVRHAAFSLAGMLAHVVAHHSVMSVLPPALEMTRGPAEMTGWYDTARSTWTAALADPFGGLTRETEFRWHLEEFARHPAESLSHLWMDGRTVVDVRLGQIPGSTLVSVVVCPVAPDAYFRLTSQELQVLSCLCCGLNDIDIAGRLHVSPRTVHAHMGSLRQKMHAASRVELAVIALASGLFYPHPTYSPIGEILRRRPLTRRG